MNVSITWTNLNLKGLSAWYAAKANYNEAHGFEAFDRLDRSTQIAVVRQYVMR